MATATGTATGTSMMRSDSLDFALTDLHTHILPAVDDGAKNLEETLEMLRLQRKSGVQRVMLTPHFYLQKETEQAFRERQQQAYQALLDQWQEDTMPVLGLGAEVRYTPELVNADLRALTFGQRDYLLLELPNTEVPAYIEQIVEKILQQGITPILAHIERYPYFRVEPERLKKLIELGALAQVTARVVGSKDDQRFARTCLENGLAHVIASDLHIPLEEQCLGNAVQKVDEELVKRAEEFSLCIWKNECPPAFSIHPVKKGLFGYC